MQIDWWTLVLQTVNFLVLVWLLSRFLLRPVREVIEKRKALAEKAFADADRQKAEAEEARQRFEHERTALVDERRDMLNRIHEEHEAERRSVLDAAQRDAEKLRETARQSIAEERESALAEMRGQAITLAADLASALLRKADLKLPGGAFLERIEQRLNDLPASETERLEADLAAEGARLTVVTASALTGKEQDEWTRRLAARFGAATTTDFDTDPDLLGGAELRFPHAAVKFSLSNQLQVAEEALRRDDSAA